MTIASAKPEIWRPHLRRQYPFARAISVYSMQRTSPIHALQRPLRWNAHPLRQFSMNEDPFIWPDDPDECAALARSMFISESVANAKHWIDWGSHFVTHSQPDKPYVRSWNAVAKEDRAFREVFSTLNDQQRAKVLELLRRCIDGAVFSTLCTLDQFPHGEAEIFVRDGVCGAGTRSFRIAPTESALHHDYVAASSSQAPPDHDRDA
jgi:hypothetical protein